MGLWSCSNDDFVQENGQDLQGHSVSVTITVSRSEAQTRTELSENTDGTLTDIWKEGDKLAVFSEDGKIYHGDLDIIGGLDTSDGAGWALYLF